MALLLPLTGDHAALGLSMQRAAALAESDAALMQVIDTGGTAPGAAAAAAEAIKRKAAMIFGPLTADEARAAAATVAGRVPVIAFTNDAAVAATGAWVFGLTPRQSTSAVLRYARSRGVKSVVVLGDASPWSSAASAAAQALQGELGIDVRAITVTPGQPLPGAGDPPDAVLATGSGEGVLAAARNLKDTGVQLLATLQALDHRPSALEALQGAWIAAPDPKAFGEFSSTFEAKVGGAPGALAALAYDAAGIGRSLRADHKLDRAGLLATDSFACVTGAVRFRADGSCARELAIVVAGPAGYESVATSRGA
ncbi:ABC transporter substrate-binding protein [Sphingomonas sp.]|uniref:ABC transporter substrate-binding protein n=1 Tax=Sphingomonas sp. TaxID=28214 RepID=UPI002C3876FD|nr:penicillin-binding protein activator [Sphingomonas sp.]HWK35626.1 penicillin-binding protein activator [Sphingomonas sp.]